MLGSALAAASFLKGNLMIPGRRKLARDGALTFAESVWKIAGLRNLVFGTPSDSRAVRFIAAHGRNNGGHLADHG
jgi:hypothetical protein